MLSVLFAASAHAAPVQRIHAIKMPLLNVPAIVKAGSQFALKIDTGGHLTLETAALEAINTPAKRFPLEIKKVSESGNIKTYSATVSPDTPEALYDLAAQFADSNSEHAHIDYQPHSVKVIKEFKTEYDFIQITDIHFNVQDQKGIDVNRAPRQLLLDAEALKPEFIIFTGDLGLEPPTYDVDYVYGYEQFLQLLRTPVYMVPGNHEMYFDQTGDRTIDGSEYWKATYGPMYHSFDYGRNHFIGMADYEGLAPKWRTRKSPDAMFFATVLNAVMSDEQWKWVKEDLAAAGSRGLSCIAYAHIPIETLQGGKKIGRPAFTVPGPSKEEFVKTLTQNGCSYLFVGHNHLNKINKFGDLTEVLTVGAGASTPLDKNQIGFRSIHVKDGAITDMKMHFISYQDFK